MEEGGRREGEVEEPKKGDWGREGGRMERWSRGCAIRRSLDMIINQMYGLFPVVRLLSKLGLHYKQWVATGG